MNRLLQPIIVCALLACFGGLARAATLERTMEVAPVRIKLSLGPTEIRVGEAPVLTMELFNTGKGMGSSLPIFSAKLQLPEGNDIEVYVQPQGEAETRLQGGMEAGVYSGTAIEVPPGRTIDHEVKLLYDTSMPNGFLFSKPGEYGIRATLRFTMSNSPEPRRLTVAGKITVRPAEGEAAEAFKRINDAESAKALQLGSIPNEQLAKKFGEVAEQYPRTTYGKACARALTIHTAYKKGADIREALPVLKKYESTYRTDSDTDLIVYTIIASYHVLGQIDLARDWMYYMNDQFPNSSLLRKQDPLYKFYYSDPSEQVYTFPWFLYEKPWIVPGATPPTSLKVLAQ
jgi:hypothetical protein